MDKLAEYVEAKNDIKCYCPGNFESLRLKLEPKEHFVYRIKDLGGLGEGQSNYVITKKTKEGDTVEVRALEDDEFIVKREPLDV